MSAGVGVRMCCVVGGICVVWCGVVAALLARNACVCMLLQYATLAGLHQGSVTRQKIGVMLHWKGNTMCVLCVDVTCNASVVCVCVVCWVLSGGKHCVRSTPNYSCGIGSRSKAVVGARDLYIYEGV
jgi:hypothetical protein